MAGDAERVARAERLAEAGTIAGTVLADEVLPAGAPWSAAILAGERLRIVDLEGRQAVDFLCYDLEDHLNRYDAPNTIKLNGNLFLGRGTTLYSSRAEKLMTVVEDTVGFHDTIGGCCSAESNAVRYGIEGTPSCRQNFLRALEAHGMGPRDVVANVNWFMYVPVAPDGTAAIVDGKSVAGDYVELVAERDVLCVISNCPQIHNPCNGWTPTPIRLIRWRT